MTVTVTASPERCTLTAESGTVEVTYQEADLARIRGRGVTLKLVGIPPFKGQYAFALPGRLRW